MHILDSLRHRSLLRLLVAVCGIASTALADDQQPPPQMAFFPGGVKVADNWVFTHIAWDELDFPPMSGDSHPVKRGESWRMYVDLAPPNAGSGTFDGSAGRSYYPGTGLSAARHLDFITMYTVRCRSLSVDGLDGT